MGIIKPCTLATKKFITRLISYKWSIPNQIMTNILFIFDAGEELQDYIRSAFDGFDVNINFSGKRDEILKLSPETEIMVGWRPEMEYLEASTNLKLFIQPGTGAEHLVERFNQFSRKNEVITTNTHRSAYNCAQHSVALLFGIMNQVVIHHGRIVGGEKYNRDPESVLLKDKTVGLLGYGPINQYAHKFLSGFDVDFQIFRRSNNTVDNVKTFTGDGLHEFLKTSNILMIALPLTQETEGLIGEKELEYLGEDAFLVNVGRGKVVQEKALYEALKNKKIRGSGLDVWNAVIIDDKRHNYHPKHPFHKLDNVLMSPHRANSGGNITRWDRVFVNIFKFLKKNLDYVNVIDLERGY